MIKSVGPYSVAIKVGNFIFLSGMIGLKENSSELIAEDVIIQTEQIFKNLQRILTFLGLDTGKIIKSTVYTTEIEQFNSINEIYQKFLKPPYPARVVVGVSKLPLNAKIEIEFLLTCS
ncbi:MAG: Rid family detoxifying hydrolase [Planctomycetota bacterium]